MAATKNSWKREPFVTGTPISYSEEYTADEFTRLRHGLVPEDMEDKWFIYFEEPHLYLHHSWTGQPIYRLTISARDGGASVVEALCANDIVDAAEADYHARLVAFLVGNLLLGKTCPFPTRAESREAVPGLLQHMVAGTRFPVSPEISQSRWWRRWLMRR